MKAVFEKLMRRGAAPGWLAVELGEASVSVAHVVPNGGEPVVEFAEERSWDPADPRTLERVAREFGAKRFRCTTLLKPEAVPHPAGRGAGGEARGAQVRGALAHQGHARLPRRRRDHRCARCPGAGGRQPARALHVHGGGAQRHDSRDGRPLRRRRHAALRDRHPGYRAAQYRGTAGDRRARGDGADVRRAGRAAHGELHGRALPRRAASTSPPRSSPKAAATGARTLLDRVLVETQRSLDHCERTYPSSPWAASCWGRSPAMPSCASTSRRTSMCRSSGSSSAQVVACRPGRELDAEAAGRWLKLIGAGMRVEAKAL